MRVEKLSEKCQFFVCVFGVTFPFSLSHFYFFVISFHRLFRYEFESHILILYVRCNIKTLFFWGFHSYFFNFRFKSLECYVFLIYKSTENENFFFITIIIVLRVLFWKHVALIIKRCVIEGISIVFLITNVYWKLLLRNYFSI